MSFLMEGAIRVGLITSEQKFHYNAQRSGTRPRTNLQPSNFLRPKIRHIGGNETFIP